VTVGQGRGEPFQPLAVGEEGCQLVGQVRMPGHQPRPVRPAPGLEVLEVSRDDLIEPSVAIVAGLSARFLGARGDSGHDVRLDRRFRIPFTIRRAAIAGLSSRDGAARRRPPWGCSARRRSLTKASPAGGAARWRGAGARADRTWPRRPSATPLAGWPADSATTAPRRASAPAARPTDRAPRPATTPGARPASAPSA